MKNNLIVTDVRNNGIRVGDGNSDIWFASLSSYLTKDEGIKRGHAVSISIPDEDDCIEKDLNNYFGDDPYPAVKFSVLINEADLDSSAVENSLGATASKEECINYALNDKALRNYLLNEWSRSSFKEQFTDKNSYIERTNPHKHVTSIGIAMEPYREGQPIHILNVGKYVEDKNFLKENFDEDPEEYEYWPSFFDDYASSIGRKIYVKGSEPGELTIDSKEAYLEHCNVIVIGTVADAVLNNDENEGVEVGAIEINIEGDDRGVIDSTQFEAIIGEPLNLDNKTKVFAIGQDGNERAAFSFDVFEKEVEDSFIIVSIPNVGSKILYLKGEVAQADASDNDKSALLWAGANNSYSKADINPSYNVFTEYSTTNLNKLQEAIQDAMNEVYKLTPLCGQPIVNNTKENYVEELEFLETYGANTTKINSKVSSKIVISSKNFGGPFEIYISTAAQKFISGLTVHNSGSFYNKGLAVLADISIPTRQEILGVLLDSNRVFKPGDRALFMKFGLYTNTNEKYIPGTAYWLGTRGNIYSVPQDFYDTVIKIGVSENKNSLLVDCSESRSVNNGDLPIGYMKPSNHGYADFGFRLMDGVTPLKISDNQKLFDFLKDAYNDEELKVAKRDFDDGNGIDSFIIPAHFYQASITEYEELYKESEEYKVNKATYDNKGTGIFYADSEAFKNDLDQWVLDKHPNGIFSQIKYLHKGVYKEMARMPFMKQSVTLKWIDDETNELVDNPEDFSKCHIGIEPIDITSAMINGPIGDNVISPSLENIDARFFIKESVTEDGETHYDWTEIHPGYHTFNEFQYYGFEWKIQHTPSNEEEPVGKWLLVANTNSGYGISYQADPFSPPPCLVGKDCMVVVSLRNIYNRQFDVDGLFVNFVKQSVMANSTEPFVNYSVSGKAVKDYIENSVTTNELNVNGPINIGKNNVVDLIAKVNAYIDTNNLILRDSSKGNYHVEYKEGELKYVSNSGSLSAANFAKISDGVRDLSDFRFAPMAYVYQHENSSFEEGVHGIINGENGNIDSAKVSGYKPQIPGAIEISNAEKLLPVMLKSGADYNTYVGNKLVYTTVKANNDVHNLTSTFTTDDSEGNAELEYTKTGEGSLTIRYGLSTLVFDGVNPLNASIGSSASLKKDILAFCHYNNGFNTDELNEVYGDGTFIENEEELKSLKTAEALQAIYEMPLAEYRYKGAADYTKKYFGIITELVAERTEKITNETINGKTTFDNVEYTYSEEEKAKIAHLLSEITDDKNKAQNIVSSIGILLKAAQETQERLLNLEVSTYGKDSPTLPGADKALMVFTSENGARVVIYNDNGDDIVKIKINAEDKGGTYKVSRDGDKEYLLAVEGSESDKFNGFIYRFINDGYNTKLILKSTTEYFTTKYDADTTFVVSVIGSDEESQVSYDVVDHILTSSDRNALFNGFRVVEDTESEDDYVIQFNDELKRDNQYDQYATNIGLNRLVKALCREVFTTYDPNMSQLEASEWEDVGLSRLDAIEDLLGEGGNLEHLDSAKSYREKIVRDNNVFSDDVTHISLSRDIEAFNNGKFSNISDAINKICLKLNDLTTSINGADDSNLGPINLDIIRRDIKTIINELFDEDYDNTPKTESGFSSYKNTGNSRLDNLLEVLFKYDIGENKGYNIDPTSTPTPINGHNTSSWSQNENDTNKVYSDIPENSKMNDSVSSLDIIIDALGEKIGNILRDNGDPIYKTSLGADADDKATTNIEKNISEKDKETILNRLKAIEAVIYVLTARFTGQLKYEEASAIVKYNNISNISDFFKRIMEFLGGELDDTGFTYTRESNFALDKGIKSIGDQEGNTYRISDVSNTIHSAAIKTIANEQNISRLNSSLGKDYEIEVAEVHDNLEFTAVSVAKNYTVNSDVSSVLKLLYGIDDKDSSRTLYPHFKEDEVDTEAFNRNDNVINDLYSKLYNMPKLADGNTSTNKISVSGNTFAIDTKGFKQTFYVDKEKHLSDGNRFKFIGASAAVNRIDLLEHEVAALYKYIDPANNYNSSFEGNFTLDSANKGINGHDWSTPSADTTSLSQYAFLTRRDLESNISAVSTLQGYFTDGKANSAATADKVSSKLTIEYSSTSSATYNGSSAATIDLSGYATKTELTSEISAITAVSYAAKAGKVENALKLNAGTGLAIDNSNTTFDGSLAINYTISANKLSSESATNTWGMISKEDYSNFISAVSTVADKANKSDLDSKADSTYVDNKFEQAISIAQLRMILRNSGEIICGSNYVEVKEGIKEETAHYKLYKNYNTTGTDSLNIDDGKDGGFVLKEGKLSFYEFLLDIKIENIPFTEISGTLTVKEYTSKDGVSITIA